MKHPRTGLLPTALIALALTAPLTAQITFMRTYGGPSYDAGLSVAQTADGGYIMTGWSETPFGDTTDIWLGKVDSLGELEWTRQFGWRDEYDRGHCVAQTADGGYIVTGELDGNGWLTRFDSSGDTLWSRNPGATCGFSVVQTPDAGYIVSGQNSGDVLLVKTDSSGVRLWRRSYGGESVDCGYSVALTTDGGYIVTGYTRSFGAGRADAWLIKTDWLGDTIWTRTYGYAAGYDYGRSVTQTADGGYVITGWTESLEPRSQLWLIKTDASGDNIWTRVYGGSDFDKGYSVVQTGDGGFLVAGYTGSFGAGHHDVWLLKTDEMGDTLWTRTFGGTARDEAYCVAQTADGGYVITGRTHSYGPDIGSVWLIKTDSLGLVGIAEPAPPVSVTPVEPTVVSASRLLAKLRRNPDLHLFDASGRRVLDRGDVRTGIVFLRSAETTRRVLVVD